MTTTLDTPAPTRPRRGLIIAAVVAVVLAVALAVLWPRPDPLVQAQERCGIGEMRDGTLVVEFTETGFRGASERLGAVKEVVCLIRELDVPREGVDRIVAAMQLTPDVEPFRWDDLSVSFVQQPPGGTVLTFAHT